MKNEAMEITDKEYKILNKHRETMKTIIVNRAISTMSIEFREDVLELAKDKKLLNCNCNSGIFTAVSRLYNAMLARDAEVRNAEASRAEARSAEKSTLSQRNYEAKSNKKTKK